MDTSNATNGSAVLVCSIDSALSKGFKVLGYVLIAVLSLVGNVLVVCVVTRSPRMRTVTNHFIANVSIADLLTTVFNMVPTLYWVITDVDVWYMGGTLGEALCKLLQFFQLVSIACSVFSMVAIAFDRVFAIYRPLKRTITFPRAKGIIAIIWIASCVISSPNLYTLRLETADGIGYCKEEWGPLFDEEISPLFYTIALFACLYVIPLILIGVLYTIVIVRLWNRPTPGQRSATNRTNRERTNRRVLKMLITVVVVFAVCWLPLYVRMFIMFSYPKEYPCGLPYHLDFITIYLGHANSSVNPYIYVIFNENFRNGFIAVVHKRGFSERYSSSRIGSVHYKESGKLIVKHQATEKLPSRLATPHSSSCKSGNMALIEKHLIQKDIATTLM